MADLARLRAILLEPRSYSPAIGAVIYHLSSSATQPLLLDTESVKLTVDWLASAPRNLYGDLLGSVGVTSDDLAWIAGQLDDAACARAATYANAMIAADGEWDRETRDTYGTAVATHSVGAARVASQTSAEFAALDCLSAAGYAGVDDAVAAVADIRRVYPNTFSVVSRQMARSRHAAVCRMVLRDGSVRIAVSPWCLSRRHAIAVLAIHLHDLRRAIVEDRLVRRATTVKTFAARTSLQAVRDLTAPALALLTRYSYDSTQMAFVDSTGSVVQSMGSRAPHVAVAFAAVFTRGSADPLLDLADARAAVGTRVCADDPHPQAVLDYYELADNPWSAFSLFSRALGVFRDNRAATPWGDRVNKGAMLGYPARGRTRHDRNTAACVNRVEEIAATVRHAGGDLSSTLIVVEWGGVYAHAVVMAAAAVAGLDIALDVADSGVDVPGSDVYGESEDPPHHYQLYLASAKRRNLPRLPTVDYAAGTPLVTKIQMVYDAVNTPSDPVNIVYLNGGVTRTRPTPVSVCSDSLARLSAVRFAAPTTAMFMAATEVLLPPVCHLHSRGDPAVFLDTAGLVDGQCDYCVGFSRAASAVLSMMTDEVRLVKARAVFAHNSHFSVEWCPRFSDPGGATLQTLDACMAANALRNHVYAEPPPEPVPGRDITSPELMELMTQPIAVVHAALSGGDCPRVADDDAMTVAASVA
uniref:Putative scaffold protein n=2 Tax=Beauveria bassiana polymycovirus 3 TaxID=1740648 RepID=A0A7R9NGG4_9VIRU|nr:putative scaffold protein [Beauveria bassiana polymycovirus 3]